MVGRWFVGGAALAAAMLAASPAAARGESRQSVEARLEAALVEALRAGGPFFTAEERALVEQACAYPAGSWNGYEFSMTDGVLHCTNGLDVDTPEIRAMMEVAAPRIGRRVAAAMAQPRVRAALSRSRATHAEAARDRMHTDLYHRDVQRQFIASPGLPSR
jgi:hypothetical protein